MKEIWVGTYASEEQEGIFLVQFDEETGKLSVKKAFKGVENPSWVLAHPSGGVLYAVNERTPDGGLTAFKTDTAGDRLIPAARMRTEGADPCHLSLSADRRFLCVANYTSGSLAVFRLDEAGLPVEMTDHLQHCGKSVHPTRQEGPHVHFSAFCGGRLYVVDLGEDRIAGYSLDKTTGKLREDGEDIVFAPGSGPRHFVCSGENAQRMYVMCELTSEVHVYEKKDASWKQIWKISALPEAFKGENTAAAIRLSADGKWLFTSNRGDDSIAVFKILPDGRPDLCRIVKTGGKAPRDILLTGRIAGEKGNSFILAANQDSHSLRVLAFDEETGSLELTGQTVSTEGRPVCLAKA